MKASNHPFPEFRDDQVKAIGDCLKAVKSGTKFIVLEAPTGAGKSAIAVELLRKLNGGRILTSQVILQNQYKKDYPEFKLLKGSSRYSCNFEGPPQEVTTKKGPRPCLEKDWLKVGFKRTCGEGQKYLHKYMGIFSRCGDCPYVSAVDAVSKGKYSIVNYHTFYYQNKMRKGVLNDTNLVLDEAHNLNKVTTNLYTRKFPEPSGFKFAPPNLDQCRGGRIGKVTGLVDKQYVHDSLQDYLFFVDNQINYPGSTTESKKKLERLKEKRREAEFQLKHCMSDYFTFSMESSDNANELVCTPIDVRLLARKAFYTSNKTIIFMSATILDLEVFCKEAGVKPSEVFHCKMPEVFPAKNHSIVYIPEPKSMAFKHRKTSLPIVMDHINDIIDAHPGQKGIIHGQTYDICDYVYKKCRSPRITYANQAGKAIKKHLTKPGSVLLSPAVKEGVSFPGADSEFQILMCVPYPVFDLHAEKKIKINGKFYFWEACVDFIQSLGRSVRSPTDKCTTYLVDARFEELAMSLKSKNPKSKALSRLPCLTYD